jgi:hypothetical protein
MSEDHESPTTIRLNILGSLEIERAGQRLSVPNTGAAHHLLALFAVKNAYGEQQLVDILWPGDSLSDPRLGVPKAVRGRLDRAISDARRALGVSAASGVLKRQNGVVHRVREDQVTITTDIDDFRRLMKSDRADDWRAALMLVRGEVAEHVPVRNRQTNWLDRERATQTADLKNLLKKLEPNAEPETIKHQVQEVFDGRWSPSPEPSGPVYPNPDAQQVPKASATLPRSAASIITRRLRKRPLVAGAVALVVASAIGIALAQSGSGTSIPPEGTVIDAQTGKVVSHPRVTVSHMPAQLEFGDIFRACDLSSKKSCGSGHSSPAPLNVNVGDVVAFRVTLNDGFNVPINYLKLVSYTFGVTVATNPHTKPKKLAVSPTELEVWMSVKWPEGLGAHEIVNEPGLIHGHDYGERERLHIHLKLPHPGHYRLVYIPGSTTLVNKETSFFHHLPDGIMSAGIDLENVGPPHSCFWCAKQYIRYVYFHLRVARA